MRRVCTRDVVPKGRGRKRAGKVDESAPSLMSRLLDRAGPTLDFNPVLWREWHRSRPPWWGRIIALAFVVLALTFSVMAIHSGGNTVMAPWVNALQVSVSFLFLSVIAATSLAEERIRGSLHLLMSTPMETREIVIGKWLGAFRLVPPMAILPVAVVLGIATPAIGWRIAIMMAAFVLCAGAAITSLGLAIATWCPRLGRPWGLR